MAEQAIIPPLLYHSNGVMFIAVEKFRVYLRGRKMGISCGKSERFKFSTGGSLIRWSPQMVSALYAITYKQDPKNKPKSHTILFFGQAENLAEQAPAYNQDILDTWIKNGGDPSELFIFVHPMPGSTLQDRLSKHEQLVYEYRPDCNRY